MLTRVFGAFLYPPSPSCFRVVTTRTDEEMHNAPAYALLVTLGDREWLWKNDPNLYTIMQAGLFRFALENGVDDAARLALRYADAFSTFKCDFVCVCVCACVCVCVGVDGSVDGSMSEGHACVARCVSPPLTSTR